MLHCDVYETIIMNVWEDNDSSSHPSYLYSTSPNYLAQVRLETPPLSWQMCYLGVFKSLKKWMEPSDSFCR